MPLNTFCFRVLNWNAFSMPCKYKALGKIAKRYSNKLTKQQASVVKRIIDRHDKDCTGCHISDAHANILIKAVPEYKEYKSLLQYGRQRDPKDKDSPQPDSTEDASGTICVGFEEEGNSSQDDYSVKRGEAKLQQDNADAVDTKS